jgi:bifunctional UDP-N-acetylglucosamine pyrophosphorylase/glucosamine-1-phosphate N-acetyltransferase
MTISAIVLAAGKGTRMKSELPKPLHQVRGRTLLAWVIEAFEGIDLDGIAIVVGHGRDQVTASLDASFDRPFLYAEQLAQRGTGDAAAVGLAELDLYDNSFSDTDHVVVLPGDTPMLTSATTRALVDAHLQSGAAATVVTAVTLPATAAFFAPTPGQSQRSSKTAMPPPIRRRSTKSMVACTASGGRCSALRYA